MLQKINDNTITPFIAFIIKQQLNTIQKVMKPQGIPFAIEYDPATIGKPGSVAVFNFTVPGEQLNADGLPPYNAKGICNAETFTCTW